MRMSFHYMRIWYASISTPQIRTHKIMVSDIRASVGTKVGDVVGTSL